MAAQKPKHVYEVLKQINDADDEKRRELIQEWGAQMPFNLIFALNFSESIEMDLPEGLPGDFQYEEISHPDLAYSNLFSGSIKKLGLCFKTNKQLPKWKKEGVFFDMLKSLCPEEGEVLVFLKDKALTELYPNITKELIGEYFPTYLK